MAAPDADLRRGDVYWYEPPDAKPRPVVVLTRDAALPVLSSVVVAPLTRTIRGIPSEVLLEPQSDGVSMSCAVNLDNQTLARRTFLTTRMTTLNPVRMAEICAAQRAASGC